MVLAAAGLEGLRRMDVGVPLEPLIPAPGQGCLALEIRSNDAETRAALESISDPLAFACLSAERDCVIALDATCDTPIGVLAEAGDRQRIRIRSYAGAPDGSVWVRDELDAGPDAGKLVAERMLSAGAAEILGL